MFLLGHQGELMHQLEPAGLNQLTLVMDVHTHTHTHSVAGPPGDPGPPLIWEQRNVQTSAQCLSDNPDNPCLSVCLSVDRQGPSRRSSSGSPARSDRVEVLKEQRPKERNLFLFPTC